MWAERGRDPHDLGHKGRAGIHARVAPEGLSALAHGVRAALGDSEASAHRLPGHRLLFRTALPDGRARDTRRGRSRTASDLRETGCAAAGARVACRRCGRCGVRQRLGGDHLQAETGRTRHHFLFVFEAVREHPDLVQQYLGTVVPYTDNFFATLNSAVFADGSFCYIPPGVRSPMELSTYFRINAQKTGQFERTLIIADKGSYVSYLEGCTAPMRDENQLHAAVVELIALEGAQIKYSTVQNWYPGDKEGKGGIYNFVTKRGDCRGAHSKISWTQVKTGSAITSKYPVSSCRATIRLAEFSSVALTNRYQQADTGTKMTHIGRNTKSTNPRQGDLGRPRAECLPRAREGGENRHWRAQLLAVRLSADGQ